MSWEIEERLNRVRSPFRVADVFGVEEIIGPARHAPAALRVRESRCAPARGRTGVDGHAPPNRASQELPDPRAHRPAVFALRNHSPGWVANNRPMWNIAPAPCAALVIQRRPTPPGTPFGG